MKKKIKLLIIPVLTLLLCGCTSPLEKEDYENIETCKNNGGTAKVEYFRNSNEIYNVTCFYGNEELEQGKDDK